MFTVEQAYSGLYLLPGGRYAEVTRISTESFTTIAG